MDEKLGDKIYSKVVSISFIMQRLRIWSRLGLLTYIILLNNLVFWVFGLPDITTAQTVIVSVITALGTPIMAFYIKTGKGLYKEYVQMEYSNRFIEMIDHVGFIIDKLRLFPLFALVYYGVLLYMSIMWGLSLGDELTMAQATFISTFAGSTSMIFGFFISSGEVNMKLEQIYVKRHDISVDAPDGKPLDEIEEEFDKK